MSVKKYLLKMGLTGLTSTALVEKGRNHVAMLTGNIIYAVLAPLLVALTAACDALDEANQEVIFNGGKIAYDNKRNCEVTLRAQITNIGEQVQVISGGDKAKILSAGFEVRRSPEPITHLDQPQDLRARLTGYMGKVALDWNVVLGARYYKVFMTAGDPTLATGWELVGSTTKSRFTLEDLVPGKYYSFRVNAVGARTESTYSDNATLMAA
jgi:hypothetical protein